MSRVLLFTQPGCFSCELMRVYLEAREIAFEERDITKDSEAQRTMVDVYKVSETPAVVIDGEVIAGFDPARLDQLFESAPSSDAVTES
jgi:glutaredoxin